MDEHQDDLTAEVDEGADEETVDFPKTADELDENDEAADEDESLDPDPSEL